MDKSELGERIKQRRIVLGLTTRGLADLTGMSPTTLSNIERGSGNPTFEVMQKLLAYLNLELKVEVKK